MAQLVLLPTPPLCQTFVPKWIERIVYEFRRLYLDCKIVFELYNYSIWHGGCRIESIVFGLFWLYLDGVDCIWIVLIVFGLCRLYLDCTIIFGLYNQELVVFGLCWLYDCIWIVRLYLDCTIVCELYNCIWIVQLRDLAQGV